MHVDRIGLSQGELGALSQPPLAGAENWPPLKVRQWHGPVRHRGESWSTQQLHARASGQRLAWRQTPFHGRAAENNQYGKQNADRCGASRGDPGRRGKG